MGLAASYGRRDCHVVKPSLEETTRVPFGLYDINLECMYPLKYLCCSLEKLVTRGLANLKSAAFPFRWPAAFVQWKKTTCLRAATRVALQCVVEGLVVFVEARLEKRDGQSFSNRRCSLPPQRASGCSGVHESPRLLLGNDVHM